MIIVNIVTLVFLVIPNSPTECSQQYTLLFWYGVSPLKQYNYLPTECSQQYTLLFWYGVSPLKQYNYLPTECSQQYTLLFWYGRVAPETV